MIKRQMRVGQLGTGFEHAKDFETRIVIDDDWRIFSFLGDGEELVTRMNLWDATLMMF